jgi:hypothetical protein
MYMTDLSTLTPAQIRDVWVNSGEAKLTPNTKTYFKGQVFQVDYDIAEAYNASMTWGSIVECLNDYRTDDSHPEVLWDQMVIDDVGKLTTTVRGVQSGHFRVLLSYVDLMKTDSKLNGINPNLSYVARDPTFNVNTETGYKVDIPDDELTIILGEVGLPFLSIDEIEYGKRDIIDTCIYPVLQEYFKWFPIVREEVYGSIGANGAFKVPYPEDAFHCVPYLVQGAGGNAGIGGGGTAFAFMSEQFSAGITMGAMGSRFGRGLRYTGKQVPGFTGIGGDAIGSRLRQMEANQGYINYFRREKYKKIKEGNKYYAYGFGTTGGTLNLRWLCFSNKWEDIDFSQLNDVRDLCTAKVLQNLGMLRALIAVEVAKIDFSLYTNRAKDISDKIMERWRAQSSNLAMSILRG